MNWGQVRKIMGEEYGDELWSEDQQKANRRGGAGFSFSVLCLYRQPSPRATAYGGQLLTERPWSDIHLGPNTSLLTSSVMLGKSFNSCETQLYHLKSGSNISEASCENYQGIFFSWGSNACSSLLPVSSELFKLQLWVALFRSSLFK